MAPYPAGYEFPLPFGDRHWLLGSSCPRRGIGLPCGWLTAGLHLEMKLADHDGISVFRMTRDAIGVGAFSAPGLRCPQRGQWNPVSSALVGISTAEFVAHRRRISHRLRRFVTSRRFMSKVQSFTRPIFASPGLPRWLWSSLGFHPGFTPSRYRYGMLDVATELDTAHGPMRSLLSCDLHVAPIAGRCPRQDWCSPAVRRRPRARVY